MIAQPVFSVIVVALNAGEELTKTIQSIQKQTEDRYEIIVKDGFSTDGSIEKIKADEKVRVYQRKDQSIYDAMNQALEYVTGKYIIFLNCGDYFHDENVLKETARELETKTPDILYGNLYNRKLQTIIYASPVMNDFTCYRNVPCHQTCFYSSKLFEKRKYNIQYTVRADYEHFLWCVISQKATTEYFDYIIADYEGGGFSETKKNLEASKKQHKEITEHYLGKRKVFKYRMLLFVSLAPLRSRLAESDTFSKFYNQIKTGIYKIRNRK